MSRKDLLDELFGLPSMESMETVNRRLRKKKSTSQKQPKWKLLKQRFGELYKQVNNGKSYLFANSRKEQDTFIRLIELFGEDPEHLDAVVEFWFLSGQTKVPLRSISVYHLSGGWLNELSISAEEYLKGTYTPQQGEKKRNREWIPTSSVASEKAPDTPKKKPISRRKGNLL